VSSFEAKLSSRGQIVLPTSARKKLGLEKGDKLKVKVDEQNKTIVMQAATEPTKEIFVRAGTKLSTSFLNESKEVDEVKLKRLLREIGAR
jgi:AbrB family looped-hinge helix DNA binding protein